MAVGRTELWFKQRTIEILNKLIKERGLGFDRAEVEQSIAVSKKRSLFFDGLIWKNRASQQAACELEYKLPDTDVADFDLVGNAAQKANAVGAPYFITWNVRDLILWKTFEQSVPLLERQCRWWRNIVDVADLEDLTEQHWRKIEEFLGDLLVELDALLNKKKRFERLPVDQFFVHKLASVVDTNYRAFADALRERALADGKYFEELRKWTQTHGWMGLLHTTAAETKMSAFHTLGRLAVFLLMNRIVFHGVVQAHHPQVGELDLGASKTGKEVERQLRSAFDAVLEIDFETVFACEVIDLISIPDGSVYRLTRFVEDLKAFDFHTLSYEVLGRVYESLIPAEERHSLGQYFTPTSVVDLINAFCIHSDTDMVLQTSCGAPSRSLG
ncbi:MAG TPA: hypothetical protein VGK67_30695 [Myxococcales bacterium]|jgi:hypothetical protein